MDIETKAEMMQVFHQTMQVTCAYCKYNATGRNVGILWCDLNNTTVGENYYCAEWEEKDDEIHR